MNSKDVVIKEILVAFGANDYPGDSYLVGSTDGCEPYEEVSPFVGKEDWRAVGAEAQAIVAYLEYKRDSDPYDLDKEQIDGALDVYWRERASQAPVADSLKQHVIQEDEYLAALESDSRGTL